MTRYHPKQIEAMWQKKWLKEKTYEPSFTSASSRKVSADRRDLKRAKKSSYARAAKDKPFYNLMMFPYPSAEGLHVGNMYAFVGADIHGRFQRMRGYDVFEPIGLDGFGIHSENYALKIGKHPMDQARASEKNFYRQLAMIGNGFAWDERLETYNPDYYKWTQWIFIQLFNKGLAYRKKAQVNWCPSCKTVLADEQVIGGRCERCTTAVIKKDLEQWFFRITKYAERLLKNLDKLDWSEYVKIAQKNWIGKSEGVEIEFRIKNQESRIKVFTTRPDTLFGATFLVVGPEHHLVKNFQFSIFNFQEVKRYTTDAKKKSVAERLAAGKDKTGVELKGITAINPATKKEISVWVADYVLGDVGTGAIMAVPAHDQRDFAFAEKYQLPVKMVICPNYPEPVCPVLDHAYEGEGHLVDSRKFTGMESGKAKWQITKFVGGKRVTQYRIRDWLISRQRYWGAPIPLIFCENCAESIKHQASGIKGLNRGELENPGWIAVSEKDLPVRLPHIKEFRPTGTGVSPLAAVQSFYKTKCPKCGGDARRETDVSDTFLDSAWYFLRYPSVWAKNSRLEIGNWKLEIPWNQEITRRWLPVDKYIGGAEHAVLHLLYTRFLTMAFYDWGLLDFEEPFPNFRAHGLLIKEGAKMSKSRGNVVNPDDYIRAYGADALRMYLMFLGPFEQGGDFHDTGIAGITRFLDRVWQMFGDNVKRKAQSAKPQRKTQRLVGALHRAIKKVTEDIEELHYNTAISALMVLLNAFEAYGADVTGADKKIFLKLLAPFAPHISEELWQAHFVMGKTFQSIHREPWPAYTIRLVKEETFELVVQINGKIRDKFFVPVGIGEKEAIALTLAREKVKSALGGKALQKTIFVPERLINFVV